MSFELIIYFNPMHESVHFKIERDPDARDGIEFEDRGSGTYRIKMVDDFDLEKNEDNMEVFIKKFNYARREHQREEQAPLNLNDRLVKTQLKKFHKEVNKSGEDRYNFQLPFQR